MTFYPLPTIDEFRAAYARIGRNPRECDPLEALYISIEGYKGSDVYSHTREGWERYMYGQRKVALFRWGYYGRSKGIARISEERMIYDYGRRTREALTQEDTANA